MNFTVTWLPLANNDLAEIWMRAPDRNAVTFACDRVDQRLAVDPLNEGESRFGSIRITFELPLRVVFDVWENSREVFVISLGLVEKRS